VVGGLRSLGLASILTALPSSAGADSFAGPVFRQGMWHFERTIERVLTSDGRHLLTQERLTRCVNPTVAMRGTFSSPDIGTCHSARPERVDNRYVFPVRCDYMGPVRTEITVESDVAYTEVNELAAGPAARVDTVVAHRIGDCGRAEAAAD
jgi:hypothetical protein